MDKHRIDHVAKLLADRHISRRQALRRGGACLGAGVLAATGVATASAFRGAPRASSKIAPAAGSDLTALESLPLTGDRLAAFEAHVATKLAEMRIPGAAVAVVQNGTVAFMQGFGVRTYGLPDPITADTLLRIGSITKSFTSLLAATLVDGGQLRWDTPLVDLLPTFAVADQELTTQLTVADAFCACSGLPRRDLELIINANEITPESLIASLRDIGLTTPYGTTYQYNNQIVTMGGYAAAVADGGALNDLANAYASALQARVLNPIGMPRTTLVLDAVLADGDYASPHGDDLTGTIWPLPMLQDNSQPASVAPAGALWSSAREMARYIQTQLGRGLSPGGERVVAAAMLEGTWEPGVEIPATAGLPAELTASVGHYAHAWVTGTYEGKRMISHSGSSSGFVGELAFLPDDNLGVVVLTNGGSLAALFVYSVQFRLLELLFDQPATFDAELAPILKASAEGRKAVLAQLGQVDQSALTPYLGLYSNPALGDLRMSFERGQLIFDAGEVRSALRPLLDDAGEISSYIAVDPPYGSFPPQLFVTFIGAEDQRPQVVLTAAGDPLEGDLSYQFDPVA